MSAALKQAHIVLTAIATHPTLDLSDYMRDKLAAAIDSAEAELSREKPAQPIAWVVRVHGETPGRPLIHWTRSEADAHAAQFSDGLASVVELTDRAHHIPAAPAQETTR